MQKYLLIFIFLTSTLFSNELVDALKGVAHKTSSERQAIGEKIECDQKIFEAIKDNKIPFFKERRGALKDLNNCLIDGELTPLMAAAYSDRVAIVKTLLDDGVEADEKNDKRYSAVHYAAFYGNYEIIEALLEKGVDVNSINDIGQTPLMIAAYYGNAKTVKTLLLRGADIKIRDKAGMSAVDLAKKKNKKEVLRLFR